MDSGLSSYRPAIYTDRGLSFDAPLEVFGGGGAYPLRLDVAMSGGKGVASSFRGFELFDALFLHYSVVLTFRYFIVFSVIDTHAIHATHC